MGKLNNDKAPSSWARRRGDKPIQGTESMKNFEKANGLLRPLPSLICLNEPASVVAEQYRILLTRLLRMRKSRPLQVIGITSAVPGEGKTTVAFNLAITMAKIYKQKTLLIETDLKKPSFPVILKSSDDRGLAEALSGWVDPEKLVRYTLDGYLGILPVGKITHEGQMHLLSAQIRETVEKLRRDFELIFMDTPPVLALADLNVLEEVMDGILFVVRADKTPRSHVSKAVSSLSPKKLLGLVLNNFKTHSPLSESYYYYHSTYFQKQG